MFNVKDKYTQVRRDLIRDQILRNGKKLNELYRKRGDIDRTLWDNDWEYLTDLIAIRERRAEKLRDRLRATHKEA